MIQGARSTHDADGEQADAGVADLPAEQEAPTAANLPTRRRWPALVGVALLAVAAVAWVAVLGTVLANAATWPLSPLRLLAWVGLGAGPLALLGVIGLLLRGSRLDARDALLASAALRADTRAVELALARFDLRIRDARALLAEQAAGLAELGESAGARLAGAARELDGRAASFRETARALDDATATARADLGVLLADLPRAEAASLALAERLREGGAEADGRGRALADLLAALDERAHAASEATGGAAARLAGQLDRLEGGTAAVESRLQAAAAALRDDVDGAMAAAAHGLEATRTAVAGQSAALLALTEQGRATLAETGDEAGRRLGARLDAATARLNGLGDGLAQQDELVENLLARVDGALATTEGRLAGLARAGREGAGGVNDALAEIDDRFDAVARLVAHQERAVAALLDRVGQLRDTAEAVAAELAHADEALARQHRTLDEAGTKANERLELISERAAALGTLVNQTHGALRELVADADGSLADALRNARTAAAEAGEQARDALTAAIPRTAQRLGESAARALTAALAEAGQIELAAVEARAAGAVDAARGAAEQIGRQLAVIAETATAIDARIAANREETEAHDEASFARAAALLIDALNSAAIDLTRLFDADVGEDAWRAYLKGDRGIFTRRAVRLLDRSEAGTIAQRYEAEADFHTQVNRYIHDFEALLRRVMGTHEGQGLATTLLSSDLGKLYVALAQAIERLRR